MQKSKKIIGTVWCLVLLLNWFCLSAAYGQQIVPTTRFGDIEVYSGAGNASRISIVLSDRQGISEQERQLAKTIVNNGFVVAIINSASYLANLQQDGEPCIYLAGEFERLGQMIQKEAKLFQYSQPIIGGIGVGASLAYIMYAQAPNSFEGGFFVDLCRVIDSNESLCEGTGPKNIFDKVKGKITLVDELNEDLDVFSVVTGHAMTCGSVDPAKMYSPESSRVVSFADQVKISEASWITNPKFMSTFLDMFKAENSTELPQSAVRQSLVELPAESSADKADYFVILISGDGGWASIDKEIGDYLQEQGISVLGFNAFKYFWQEKTPSATSADIGFVLDQYLKKWNKKSVYLIGYSFGADVIPFIYNRLTPNQAATVSAIGLLNPSLRATFEIHITDWMLEDPQEGVPLSPELIKINKVPVLCLYGTDEDDTICRSPELSSPTLKNLVKKDLPGTHHFDGDYEKLAKVLLEFKKAKMVP